MLHTLEFLSKYDASVLTREARKQVTGRIKHSSKLDWDPFVEGFKEKHWSKEQQRLISKGVQSRSPFIKGYGNVLRNLKTLREMGAKIAFGTDAYGTHYGYETHRGHPVLRESCALKEIGYTDRELLGMSLETARLHGIDDTGSIEKGYHADIIFSQKNPVEDYPEALRKIDTLMVQGRFAKG